MQRFILSSEVLWFREIAEGLNKEFPELKVNHKELKYCMMKFASLFITEVKQVMQSWGKEFDLVNTRSKNVLKIQYRPAMESVNAMGHTLVDNGIVKIKKK